MLLLLLVALVVLFCVLFWVYNRRVRKVLTQLREELDDAPKLYFSRCQFRNTPKLETLRISKVHPGAKALLAFRFGRDRGSVSVGGMVDMHEIAREYADKLLARTGAVWSEELKKETSDVVDFLAQGRRF